MKRVFLIIALALMLASCASSRKVQESTAAVVVDSASVKEATKHESEKVVDTTRTEHGKVVITEIIFDTTPDTPPATDKPDARASPDTVKSDKPAPTPPTASVNIPGFGQVSGNIKSIRQTVIESDNETKGESKESEKQEDSKCNANVSVAEENNQRVEEPVSVPDPKRWRYIFYIVAVGVVALLYLKRVPILNWIKRILSGLRRIF